MKKTKTISTTPIPEGGSSKGMLPSKRINVPGKLLEPIIHGATSLGDKGGSSSAKFALEDAQPVFIINYLLLTK